MLQDKEIECNEKNAKIEFKKGNYELARNMFQSLWGNSNHNNAFLLYDYGQTLRKTKESIKFIEICRELNDNHDIMSNKWIISTLCWCLYDCYINKYTVADKGGFNDFIKRAEYIKNNCEQMNFNEYYKNPYVLTIMKVVKVYNNRASKNFNEMIKWLSYLDSAKLSEEVFIFQDESGRDRELASSKEFYYQHMAKALEKTGKYESCIEICKIAFKQISKFHYRNSTWLKARMYYSKCMLQENIEDAILEYKELADRENCWFMYHKLSQICFRYNKISESLLYASKAVICRFEHEKMVNLMSDTALLWQAEGNGANAKHFFQASAFYRKRQGWSFSEELQYAIKTLGIDVEKKPNISTIQGISRDYIATIEVKCERLEGQICNIISHGGSGFIKPCQGGLNVYFNMKDVYGKEKLVKGDKVEYELLKAKDEKVKAVKIIIRG